MYNCKEGYGVQLDFTPVQYLPLFNIHIVPPADRFEEFWQGLVPSVRGLGFRVLKP